MTRVSQSIARTGDDEGSSEPSSLGSSDDGIGMMLGVPAPFARYPTTPVGGMAHLPVFDRWIDDGGAVAYREDEALIRIGWFKPVTVVCLHGR